MKSDAARHTNNKAETHEEKNEILLGMLPPNYENHPLNSKKKSRGDDEWDAYNLPDGKYDYIFSSHTLEHLDRWQEALSLWISKLRINGIVFLYLPHESMRLWEPGGPWVGDAHKWVPTCNIITAFLANKGLQIIESNSGRDVFWSFHIVAKKILD